MSNKELELKAMEHDVSDATPEAVAEAAVATEKVIESAVVGGYKKIEDAVVGGYKKIENKFTEAFLNEDGTMKTGKAGQAVVDGFKKIEDGVVGGYKKIENGVVEGFTKVTDKCVEVLFAREGESVEDAKKRLSGKE